MKGKKKKKVFTVILILVVYLSWNTLNKNVSVLYGRFFDIERGTGTFHPVSQAGGLQIPATLLLLYPLPGCCGLHWFCLHYHSHGEQRETHSYCFILFLATVVWSSFIYTIILMVSKEKHTLIALSSSWLLQSEVVLSTLSFLWWAKRNTLVLLYPLPGYCGL